MDQFQSLLNKMSSWVNDIVLALPNIVVAVIVLSVSYFLSRRLKTVVVKGLSKTTSNQTIIGLVSTIAVAMFLLIALFIVLNILHLSDAVTALLGTAGVVGLAVGLALQDPIINLFSGVLMSTKDFYKVGDLIETNGFTGVITHITLRDTILLQADGKTVILPNKDVLQQSMTNITLSKQRRVEIDCGVSYGDDLEQVKDIAINAIKDSNINYDTSKAIDVYFCNFGASAINFKLRFWNKNISQQDYDIAVDKAIIAVKKAFDQSNISIPFPIQTLDFGIKGGLSINEIYPPQDLTYTRKEETLEETKNNKVNRKSTVN